MNSRLPGIIGECSGNLNVLRSLVNEAQERLLKDPLAPDEGWWGGWAEMVFNVVVVNRQAYVICPHDVARLIGVNICNIPVKIHNEFYEYMAFGTGARDFITCCSTACLSPGMFERPNVATMAPLVGTKYLQVYIDDTADIGAAIKVQGEDSVGKPILEMDGDTVRAIQGETITLEYPFTTSVNQYSKITGIMKGSTLGQVTIYQYDGTTAEALTTLQPGETTAHYRKYLLTGLPNSCFRGTSGTIQVTAKVKLDLVPAMSPQDYLLIQCVPALIEELQAIRYGSMDESAASKKELEHHTKALRLLFGELDHHMGKVNVAIRVPIFGSQPLKRQPW